MVVTFQEGVQALLHLQQAKAAVEVVQAVPRAGCASSRP